MHPTVCGDVDDISVRPWRRRIVLCALALTRCDRALPDADAQRSR